MTAWRNRIPDFRGGRPSRCPRHARAARARHGLGRPRRWRAIVLSACAALAALGTSGRAVAGSCAASGPAILDEPFADARNGWPKDETAKFSPDGLTLILNPRFDSYFYTNPLVQAHDADYCLEAVVPTDFTDKRLTAVGLLFLYENSMNYWTLELFGDGFAQIEHLSEGKRIVPYSKAAPGDPKPGSVVALRARVKDGQIRFSIDGTEIALLKADLAVGDLSFGAYVHKDEPPAPALAFTFGRMVVGRLP